MAKVDGFRALADVVSGSYENRTDTRYATVSRIADDGTAYVRFPGGEDMPVHNTLATVEPGDSVPVTIAKGRATIRANATDLPASSTSVERVGDDALQALKESAAASSAAASAVASAAIANEAASQAVEDAATAKAAATQAQSDAADAKQSAADAAQDAATARQQAASAVSDASTAKQAATEATATANGAVTALATVQGVVDTLETDVDDLQTHVAMMDAYSDGHGGTVPAGLHVVPTGAGYFLVIANDGTYVYDAQSVLVTKFGESIDFSSTRAQRIGNDTAYVEFYDSDNDGVPDAIRISGTNLNTAISSVQSTLNTKANSSTVQTLRSEYNETKTTVSGHETRLTATESVANGVRSDLDNLEIGGRNLVQWSKLDYAPSESQTLHPTNPVTYYAEGGSTSTWELVTEDGYKCWHVAGDLAKTKYITFRPAFKHESGIIRTASCDIKLVDYAAGTTNTFVAFYMGGETIDGTWRGPRTVKYIQFRDVNNEGWVRVFTTWKWPEYAWTKSVNLQVYARDFTGDLYVKDVKLEEGNLPSPWTPAPEDLETEVTSLKTDYATYKQTTTESLTSIGTRMTTAEGKITTAETNIASNANAISLNASKLETVANPNLSPFFSSHNTDGTYPNGGVGGYWQPTTDKAYWRDDGRITALEDGWAHVDVSASRPHEYAPKRIDSLEPGDKVTVLVEWRNASYTGDGAFHYSRDYHTTNTQLYGGGLMYGQTLATQMNSESGEYRGLTTVSNADGTADWNALIDFSFLAKNGSSTWTGDIRISFYKGDYKGPYKPYSGSQLYASQAELKVTNDAISSKVSTTDYNGETVASLINQSADSVKIQAKHVEIDGTAIFSAISSDVDDAITDKGYQTATDVSSAITSGTSNLATKANAVKRTQRIYYRKSASGAPAAPGTASTNWVTNGNADSGWTKYNAWSTRIPPIAESKAEGATKYPYLYTCEQREMGDGNLAYTTVLLDDSTTIIDGGNIITGSVAANRIDAASGTFAAANIPELTADHIKANVIDAVNNGTGTINADKVNASGLVIAQSQVTSLEDDLGSKADNDTVQEQITDLATGVSGVSESVGALGTNLEEFSAATSSALDGLSEQIDAVPGQISDAVKEEKEAREASESVLAGDISDAQAEIESHGERLESLESAVKITPDGIDIAKAGSVVTTRYTNNALQFLVNGEEDPVTYIGVDEDGVGKLFVTNAVVVQELQFGDWAFVQRGNGHLTLKWIGTEA